MYIKKFKLENYRKFSNYENVINFICNKIYENGKSGNGKESQEIKVDIASDTTLIIGKNNAGKTTIINALDQLVNSPNSFGINDFNYRYLNDYLKNYKTEENGLPYIEFIVTIELDDDSNDRVTNLIPFMLIEDMEEKELEICIRYEITDEVSFHKGMKVVLEETDEDKKTKQFYKLLNNTNFKINFYDKNRNKISSEYRLSNIIDIHCMKANLLKNEHCLATAFNKIINYRQEVLFKQEDINNEIETINLSLSEKIKDYGNLK